MNDCEKEFIRGLNERALQWGRERQSEETGFIHLHYHIEREVHQAVPTYENFLFAYALLKSRTVEAIQEAKQLIDRLLYYQNERLEKGRGNFPIYLHDAPICHDPLLPLQLLVPCYFILSQFGVVIGEELVERLSLSVNKMVDHLVAVCREKPLSAGEELRFHALQRALKRLPGGAAISCERGEIREDELSAAWFSTKELGEMTLSLQILYGSIEKSPWSHFWEHLNSSYDRERACYTGPSLQSFFWEDRPLSPLYDAYMALFAGEPCKKLLSRTAVDLTAALVQDYSDRFEEVALPFRKKGFFAGTPWEVVCSKEYSLSYFDHQLDKNDSYWKGAIPFLLNWREGERALSLVAQGGNYSALSVAEEGETGGVYRLLYDLSLDVDTDHKEQKKELLLSVTKEPSLTLLVNKERSNTFQLGDKVQIVGKEQTIELSFSLEEGEGRFFGHIMAGNRISQLATKNGYRFNAYDWQIFLRTLEREGPCRLSVTIGLVH